MNDQQKAAFEFAKDTVRQFITLATGILALTITFSKDFVGSVSDSARIHALISWAFFLCSVTFGLWALMALTGSLQTNRDSAPSIRGWNVRIPAGLQVVSFLGGLIFAVVFAIAATSNPRDDASVNRRTELSARP